MPPNNTESLTPFDPNDNIVNKLKNGYNPMAEGVRWSEKYADKMDGAWVAMPKWMQKVVASIFVFLFGITIQGDWILISVHFLKQIGILTIGYETQNNVTQPSVQPYVDRLLSIKMDNWSHFVISALIGSYFFYFVIGGLLHWYFYVRQRDRPHEWKCQPEKFLTPELHLHEIIFGSLSLLVVSILTGTLTCYIVNDGRMTTIYYDWAEYGWWWLFAQIPITFIYQDYVTYLMHRAYHTPFLYKHFHKMHHKYKQPTVFATTAIHPVEIVNMQLCLMAPLFVYPVHWAPFYLIAFYTYYHAIIDHSGITFKAQWWQPWQPDAIFHDNHHQYTHVNFGFNIYLWDKLHGTYRRKDRVYSEDIFYGKGKALDEVDETTLMKDIAERKSENPLAYKDNVNINNLSKDEIKKFT